MDLKFNQFTLRKIDREWSVFYRGMLAWWLGGGVYSYGSIAISTEDKLAIAAFIKAYERLTEC